MAFGALWVAGPSLLALGTVAPTVKGPKPLPVPSGMVATASCDGWSSTGVDVGLDAGRTSSWLRVSARASEDAFTLIASIDDWHTTSRPASTPGTPIASGP